MRTRLLDWRSRLVAWGLALQGQTFVWGKTDCATLGREALQVCFGEDVVPHIGKPWTTMRQAAKRLQKFPYREQLEALGAEQNPLAFMRAGDIVIGVEPTERLDQLSVMVCLDASQLLASSTVDGVRILDRRAIPDGAVAYSLWEVPDRG